MLKSARSTQSWSLLPCRTVCATLTLLSAASACAPATRQQPDSQQPNGPAALRLVSITPPIGARVDSSTVLVARLAYHIPDFDASRKWVITALFTQPNGSLSSRGGEEHEVTAPYGVVTIRRPLVSSRGIPGPDPASHLTGVFYLLRHDSVPTQQDTIRVGNQMRIRTSMSRSSTQARSRTFYYNGGGPTRILSADLISVLAEYASFRPHKALAVAYDSERRWTYGFGYGFPNSEAAMERALEECQAAAVRRQITAPCQLVPSDATDGVDDNPN